MTLEQIKNQLKSSEYNFLQTDAHLGNNIILLGLGGSHAYGTNIESSDLDIRGVALNSKEDILTESGFEQVINENTDTTIYSFNKIIKLLCSANPNVVELLGLKPEHYLYLSPIGKELLDNKKLFLSKRAVHSFGGYATAQLRRLDNKAARLVGQAQREQHILNSINNAVYTYREKFFPMSEDDYLRLYLADSDQENFEKEIFMDVHLTHYPLRDYKGMTSDMANILKDYAKIGSRNSKAIEHGKLAKHMMHLIRLYLMCLDILEHGEIITYREKDHDYLMEIRDGKYLDENRQPIPEFFEIVDNFEKKLEYAKENTDLPDKPDYKAIKDFSMSVNERVIKGEV
ncbi:MAG: nucleotidyltransferase domain-containing protein [Bacteroidales bacterium]|nr:nucleotidyltransferase domain-containing protein [Bacteroidales bacterium]